MKKTFYSNGKLLITGDYTVLDGATALALPTKFGQSLEVEETDNTYINWKSYDADGTVWYEDVITIKQIIDNTYQGLNDVTKRLITILHEAYLLNPDSFNLHKGYTITTRLTFARHWGLGTSSTLLNNLGNWLMVDPYILLAKSFKSSGYDIACAANNTPILYRRDNGIPVITPVSFNPVFKDNLYFVYLNKKQDSLASTTSYRELHKDLDSLIPRINKLTNDILTAQNLRDFASALKKHEALMSGVLGVIPVQEQLFPDFKGVVKSLGAWGGDFVMAVSEENPIQYFKDKGYDTVVAYADMIL